MTDKAIIKSIFTIHFSIVSFISFIVSTFFVLTFLLQNGIEVKSIDFKNLKINGLYIIWDEKLSLTVENLEIDFIDPVNGSSKHSMLSKKALNVILKTVYPVTSLFKKVEVKKILLHTPLTDLYGNFYFDYTYNNNKNKFTLISQTNKYIDLDISLDISNSKKFILIELEKAEEKKHHTKLVGTLIYDIERQQLLSNIKIDILDQHISTLFSQGNIESIDFNLQHNKEILNYKNITSLFNLNANLLVWIRDNINSASLFLNNATAKFSFNNPDDFLDSLQINATIYNPNYTFEPNSPVVIAKELSIKFSNKLLSINFVDATFKNQIIDNNSALTIDFNPSNPLLDINLLSNALINEDITNLLSQYNIVVPFSQVEGKIKSRVDIQIDLVTDLISTKAIFKSKHTVFNFNDNNITINNALLHLDNLNLSLKHSDIIINNNIEGSAYGDINLKDEQGVINFDVKKSNFTLNDLNLSLQKNSALNLEYHYNSGNDTIYIAPSSWQTKIKDKLSTLNINSSIISFNLQQQHGSLQQTAFNISKYVDANVSLDFNLKNINYNGVISINKLQNKNVELLNNNLTFSFHNEDNNTIKLLNSSQWYFNKTDSYLYIDPTNLLFTKDFVYLSKTNFSYDNILKSSINGKLNFSTQETTLYLNNLQIKNKNLGSIINIDEELLVHIHKKENNETEVSLPKLNLSFNKTSQYSTLTCNDISTITEYSQLLHEYNISKGSFTLKSYHEKESIKFKANIDFPYSFFGNNTLKDETIKGVFSKNSIIAKINKNFKLKYSENNISLNFYNTTINIPQIRKFLNDHKRDNNSTHKEYYLITGKQTALQLSDERLVLSDTFTISYDSAEDILEAKINHYNGKAVATYQDNKFSIYGHNFNDLFMKNIFLSNFTKGKFSFSVEGNLQNYHGVGRIENTTLSEYKLLNNMVAFVDTIPSLTTFSLPYYNTDGFFVSDSFVTFKGNENNMSLENIHLNADAFDIYGSGNVNLQTNKLDIALALKSNLGSSFKNIPVVGYLILGEDGSLTTSLRVTGNIKNPTVDTIIAQEIFYAPFNIIKRAVIYPLHLFSETKKSKNISDEVKKLH